MEHEQISPVDAKVGARMANMSFAAAVLVVATHLGNVPAGAQVNAITRFFLNLTSNGITWIAVPWFFFAAGYFVLNGYGGRGWYCDSLKKRVKSLLVPYVSWSIIMVGLAYFAGIIGASKYVWPYEGIIDFVCRVFGLTTPQPAYNALWFLRALMMLVVISPLLIILSRNKVCFLFLFFFVWALRLIEPSLNLHDNFFYSTIPLEGLFCYCAGMRFRISGSKFSPPLILSVLSLLLGVAGFACFHLLGWWVRWPAILMTLFGVVGVVPTRKWPAWLTGLSFPIYLLHFIVITFLSGILKRFHIVNWDSSSILAYLISVAAVVVVSGGGHLSFGSVPLCLSQKSFLEVGDMKVFLINLPKNTDRREFMDAQLKRYEIEYELISGVNGKGAESARVEKVIPFFQVFSGNGKENDQRRNWVRTFTLWHLPQDD